jgi:hypothetical protein
MIALFCSVDDDDEEEEEEDSLRNRIFDIILIEIDRIRLFDWLVDEVQIIFYGNDNDWRSVDDNNHGVKMA